jgi:hypothetical protein
MPSDLAIVPPSGPGLSTWKYMSRRERLHACALAFVAGYDLRSITASRYDTDADVVLVPGPGRDAGAWRVCGSDADATAAEIERRWGAEARAQAEQLAGASPTTQEETRG